MKKPPSKSKKPSSSSKPDASVRKRAEAPPKKKTATARPESGTKTPASLRREAEKRLRLETKRIEDLSSAGLKTLVHELGTHQIELEMQNEELRRAQEELVVSRQRYSDLYEFAPVGYVTLDERGLIREANLIAGQMLGRSKRGLLNKPFKNFVKADDWKAFHEHWTATVESWRLQTREIALWRANGNVLPVQLQSIAVEDANAAVTVRTSISDITERRAAEQALRESERTHRTLAENVPDIVYRVDLQQCAMKFFNDRIIDITGYRPEELRIGSVCTLDPHIVDEDRQPVIDIVKRAIRDRSSFEVEYRFRHKDGRIITLLERSAVVSDRAGTAVFIDGVIRDITERKRAEEALRESESRYRSLFGNMINGFAYHRVIYGEDGRPVDYEFQKVNDAFEKLVGLAAVDIVGRRFSEVLPAITKDGADWLADYGRVARTGKEMQFEQHATVLEKQFLISAYAPSRGHLAAIFEDVTARKLAEKSLREANAELEVVNKELEAFSFAVANDLRAPLRSIEGFTQALAEDYGERLDEGGRDYCRRIGDGAHRMNQLVDAMLSMARQTRGELTQNVVNLTAAARAIVEELRAKQPEREVRFVVAPGMKVMGDREMLQAVLENLLENSWKFTAKHPAANIEVGVTEVGGEKAYFVRDDGAGFDMAYAENLFSPFRRFHDAKDFPGIGIGLAIANNIVKRHGGRMWAESEPEKGAVFYFTL